MRLLFVLTLLFPAALLLRASLDEARAEPNLEKRSGLALANAAAALKEAREAYRGGDTPLTMREIAEVEESVELGYDALMKTGKDPRKSPKWFKRAEISTRDLLRSMESLSHDMSFTDRPMLDKARERVQQIHDELLTGLMEGKHK